MKDRNPFKVRSPEKISAKDAVSLFVDVFNDFPNVLVPGNTFINGPRGCGKSMMYRYMMPDSQAEEHGCTISDLEYYSCYVPIKATNLDKSELHRLREQAQKLINEHILTTHIGIKFIAELTTYNIDYSQEDFEKCKMFYEGTFKKLLRRSSYRKQLKDSHKLTTINELLHEYLNIFEDLHDEAIEYSNRLGFRKDDVPFYEGPLCNYLNFFHPLLLHFTSLDALPSNIYILIDDADNLSDIQKQVLNTWVSYRLGTQISIKVSTQMRYNIYSTLSGHTIDSPHDYSEVNISTVYTSSKNKYKELIWKIVKRRLEKFKIEESDPDKFFPEYEKQNKQIRAIYDSYVKKFEKGENRGSQKYNDASRYSRPDYIKLLKSGKKQGSSYYYCGFEQLVHLSSGIVRFFLESAALMYSEMIKESGKEQITSISYSVQNKIVRNYANEFLFDEFDRHKKHATQEGLSITKMNMLENLINGLGGIFSAILLSEASERRVFSVAIADKIDEELAEVFELGIQLGYFQFSTIGNKEGTGRTRLYIMNRRLAPIFTLDPTSFAGYKFFKNEELKVCLLDSNQFINQIKRKLKLDPNEDLFINQQLELFGK
jgi:hypothetical protein